MSTVLYCSVLFVYLHLGGDLMPCCSRVREEAIKRVNIDTKYDISSLEG